MNLIALPKFVTKVSDQGVKREREREREREEEVLRFGVLKLRHPILNSRSSSFYGNYRVLPQNFLRGPGTGDFGERNLKRDDRESCFEMFVVCVG